MADKDEKQENEEHKKPEQDWADIQARLQRGEAVSCYPGEPPTRLINGYYCRGISKAELAHHNRRPSPVTGSAFKEQEQTQEQTTQADVDYITEWLEKL
jgi:hypothetical protein